MDTGRIKCLSHTLSQAHEHVHCCSVSLDVFSFNFVSLFSASTHSIFILTTLFNAFFVPFLSITVALRSQRNTSRPKWV